MIFVALLLALHLAQPPSGAVRALVLVLVQRCLLGLRLPEQESFACDVTTGLRYSLCPEYAEFLTLRVSPPAHPETISRGAGESGAAGCMQLRSRLRKNKDRK